jgi:hypothetical protein
MVRSWGASAASGTALFGLRPKAAKTRVSAFGFKSLTRNEDYHAGIRVGRAPNPGRTGPQNGLPGNIPVCHAEPDRFKVRGACGIRGTPGAFSD